MEELKKCPFCGNENVRLLRFGGSEEYCIDDGDELDKKEYYPYIHCYNCDIDFSSDSTSTPREIIEKWNRRCCE